ncbi:MAG: NAD(P)/FAD-dependent oxidoreductase [Oscillospiraceae bacterium]|nr:NAD(P)/FAD-dependent oxidoreductase [Oscillospiraceae bacterium]
MNNYDVIIIGGGAAGCFAAAAGEGGGRALIIEKNGVLMKKLAITGKGRCNLTNNCDAETVLGNIPRNAAFMRSALSRFSPADTMAFFGELGVPLKTERGGRVFPVSDKSGDVVFALEKRLRARGVEIAADRAVSLIIENKAVKGVKCANAAYYSENVILAAGGMSYPKTGSTGDGFELARSAGHTVTPIKPALVPLVTAEDCSGAAGLTLKNVTLTLTKNGGCVFSGGEEVLFTHFGVSGPAVLSASFYVDDPKRDEYALSIDLKPALSEKVLDARILRDFGENKNRRFKNALSGLLPQKIIALFTERSGIPPEKRVNEITKEERKRMLSALKNFSLSVKATRPIDEALVTNGGVSVKEIDPKTMRSGLVKGLYFAGEVIDVAGLTGGFNLQIAFSTAYAARTALGLMTLDFPPKNMLY